MYAALALGACGGEQSGGTIAPPAEDAAEIEADAGAEARDASDGAPGDTGARRDVSDAAPESDTGEAREPCSDPGAVHVAPSAVGSADGASESDAIGAESIDDALSAAGPGGLVCLAPGRYTKTIELGVGGEPGAPVTVRGQPGALMSGSFVARPEKKFGDDAVTIAASHIILEGIACEGVGQCVAIPKRDGLVVEEVTIRSVRAANVGTGIDVRRSGPQIVRGLRIEDVMILRFSRIGILLASTTEGATIERVYVDMQPEKLPGERGSDYPVGIALYNEVRDVVIEQATVLNVLGKPTGYTQGDGVDGERSVRGVQIRDSFFAGHRDGCIDIKSPQTVIDKVTGVGCKRTFRLWQNDEGDGPRCVACTSYDPSGAHLFSKGGTPARLEEFTVYSSGGAKLVIYDGEGSTTIKTLRGSLSDESKIKGATIETNAAMYGAAFSTPAAPNPTSFTP